MASSRASNTFPRLSSARPSMAREYPSEQDCFYISSGYDEGEPRHQRQRRSSFRKAFSLITDTSRKSVDQRSVYHQPTQPQTQSLMQRKSWGHLKRCSKTSVSVPPPQSPPQYYRDSSARHALKTSLATPQSFQDALEFGFPTNAPHNQYPNSPPLLPRISSLAHHDDKDLRALDQSGVKSFFDDSYDSSDFDDDNTSEPEYREDTRTHETPSPSLDGPRTPGDAHELDFGRVSIQRKPVRTSIEEPCTALPRPSYQFAPRSRADTWEGDREVTMRMTLTRPELREPSERIYGFQKKQIAEYDDNDEDDVDDALALEALPQPLYTNERTIVWSNKKPAQSKGKVRNLFSRKKR